MLRTKPAIATAGLCLVPTLWLLSCSHRALAPAAPAKDGGIGVPGWLAIDAAPMTDLGLPDSQSGVPTPPYPDTCIPWCLNIGDQVFISGTLDLPAQDASIVDLDGLRITVCFAEACLLLPRRREQDAWSSGGPCADAGSACLTRSFGFTSSDPSYASLALTSQDGQHLALSGNVMFAPPSLSTVDASGAARITIQSGDTIYLDATSDDCTTVFHCCARIPHLQCRLEWH